MKKTILVIPPLSLSQRMGVMAEGGAVMPGLGILYIAAFLREKGLPVRILDAEGLGLDLNMTVKSIVNERPDVVGITTTTLSIVSAAAVAGKTKKILPHTKVFLGGPHVTAMPFETMKDFPDIDGCILGDGEINFLKIVQNINNNNDFHLGIDGLVWRNRESIFNYPKRKHLTDLDILPFPAWDLLFGFPNKYRPPFHSYRKLPVANIITTRGCPYSCSFCDRSVFGRKVSTHSIDYVIDMVKYLVKKFGVREISIKDDMFLFSAERVHEFCRQIRKHEIDIIWSCNARVNNVSDELIKDMSDSGCWMISYGIESGSYQMLQKMMKGISKNQIMDALKFTRKHGVISKGFFMLGAPGETKKTLKETLDYIKKLPLDEMNVNFFAPFPGSKLFHEVIKEGFKIDFSKMNMLEPVYVPQNLTSEDLIKYQRHIILSFYLNFSKIAGYVTRTLKNIDEFKRILRMSKVFFHMTYSSLKRKTGTSVGNSNNLS